MDKREEISIHVEHVTWIQGKQAILNDITHLFEEGNFYGILGPNGSGKTSLIRHLLRFLPIKQGDIQLNRQSMKQLRQNQIATNISFVPQNTNLDASFSVYEVVAMGRTPYQTRFSRLSKQDEEYIEEALELTNCISLTDKKFHQLSGGEAQRVLIARAIAQHTSCMILDEPISHLDIRHQVELMETLKKLNLENHVTIIAILHDLNLAAAYCNQIVLMKDGQIFDSGSVEKVMTRDHLKKVYGLDFYIETGEESKQRYYMPVIRGIQ